MFTFGGVKLSLVQPRPEHLLTADPMHFWAIEFQVDLIF